MLDFYVHNNGVAHLGPCPLAPYFDGVAFFGTAEPHDGPVDIALPGCLQPGDVIHIHDRGTYKILTITPIT